MEDIDLSLAVIFIWCSCVFLTGIALVAYGIWCGVRGWLS